MHHLPAEPPAFFRRGPSPLARLAFFCLLSIGLLVADARFGYLEGIRQVAAVVLAPLQRAARVPGEALGAVGTFFASQRALTAENEELRRRLLAQGPAAQGYQSAQAESARLRALLDVRSRFENTATAVRVLYSGRDPFSQKLFVDRGADSNLVPGEAVIDAEGVVGQVTRVLPTMAEVTLITDKDHAVPVKVERSGVRSVLFGVGAGRPPELRFMPPQADIQVGDVLITSGLDGTYPAGLAVAKVTALERDTGQMFARIQAVPLAGVDRSEHLLVLARSAALPPRPEPADDDPVVRKSGKGRGKR
jgi:rod shape-determining protein MreC